MVQSQIAVLSAKKTRTPVEQATLQKLFNEQQEILLSGKIIPTVPGQNTQGLTFVSIQQMMIVKVFHATTDQKKNAICEE